METVILVVAVGCLCILSFLTGAKVGQQVSREENVTLPDLNPVHLIQDELERHEARKGQKRQDVILQNIESYDGTPLGQLDVPGM